MAEVDGADTFCPFKRRGFVFAGGNSHTMYIQNYSTVDYSFSYSSTEDDFIAFSSNKITFLKSGKYNVTINYLHSLDRITISSLLNNVSVDNHYFLSNRLHSFAISVNKGDILRFTVYANGNTSLGDAWYDSSITIR